MTTMNIRIICRRLIIALAVVCGSQVAASAVADDGTAKRLAAFLDQHCTACHGADTQEADVRLDRLTAADSGSETIRQWTRVVDAIESGEMPPEGEDRPNAAAVKRFVSEAGRFAERMRGERPLSLRRMNRREYQNTVHDLLGIDVPLMDLLPEDGSLQGFDNVADGLSISSVLMEQYLAAAAVAFEATIRRVQPLPVATRRADLMQVKENIDSVDKKKGGTVAVDESFVKFTPGWPPARIDPAHPIEDGLYRCRVAVWPHDPGERTLSVALYVGSLFGPDAHRFIGIFDATGSSQQPRVIEFTVPMQQGDTIHIVPRIWPEHVTWRDKHESRPGVGIAWVETDGPLDQEFPSLATQRLFGDVDHIRMEPERAISMRHRKRVQWHRVESERPREDVARIVRDLLPQAFRRPVDDAEAEPFVRLALDRLDAGRSFEQAVRAGVTAVLCAPQFLLLNSQPTVDDYTIASRLSYFLWTSQPDPQLIDLAAAGKLKDPAIRRAQVLRMLADPKREQFVENFLGQWLDLREIDFTTPDKKLYPEFDPLLQEAMLGETRSFFEYLIDEDGSVLNFIDSDFTFLNERLAKHYGIAGVRGNEVFRKVALPDDSLRGGVLTHASVLKVTANGTTTSPIQRGNWVLDNLLGRPAPPPPPGVPAVEPDVRGATTIREQLDKHRAIDSCNVCHRRIDPPGFALEAFDAIGGQRQWYRSIGEGEKLGRLPYRKGPDVETASRLADGRSFADFGGYRQRLLEDRDQVARAIATKLIVYATGRPLSLADRPAIDRIVAATGDDLGLRSMILAIASSELFIEP